MSSKLEIMKKHRPSLSDCGVRPLSRKVHHYLMASYLLWPLTLVIGKITTETFFVLGVFSGFIVLGFMFYNLLVAMCQMSHEPSKRLKIGRWIFYVSLTLFIVRAIFVL